VIKSVQIYRCRLLAVAVCLSVFVQSAFAAPPQVGLRIQVVAGDGVKNIVEQIPAVPITVRVVDRNNRPVQGATVVFTTPNSGPSGDFENGLNSFTTITDEEGLAAAHEFRPNDIEGPYQIRVRAQHMDEIAAATIRQTNIGARKSLGKIIAIMAVAGVAGAAGAALAARGGGNASPNSPPPQGSPVPPASIPTISFGGSTVTGPR
jgi:hypothetical protein